MAKVLVVDDTAIVREPISETLRAAGYAVVSASTGREAISLLKAEHPDVVLLDIHLPEIDGLRILEAIRVNPATKTLPVLVLTQEEKKEFILHAVRLGIQGYLLKSKFSMRDLLTRIQKLTTTNGNGAAHATNGAGACRPGANSAAPAPPSSSAISLPVPQLLKREDSIKRAEKAFEAKTLSGAVTQVIGLASSTDGDASQLATLIGRDPVLSARVLQAANSAFYAAKRGVVSTVADAVKQIGFSAVCNIASTIGLLDAMPPVGPDGFNPMRCWQHSLAVAQLCERLAAPFKEKDSAGTAYLVGLCHDLGEILFHSQFGKEFRQVVEMQQKTGRRREELERAMLGVTQSDLVKTMVRCLQLPDSVRHPIEALHAGHTTQPTAAKTSRGDLTAILRFANLYANGILLAAGAGSRVAPIKQADYEAVLGGGEPFMLDAEKFRTEIFSLTLLMTRLTRSEEAELARPLVPRRDIKLWLARDPAFSAFCPVTTALTSVAKIELHNRLPHADELTDHAGLIVLADSPATGKFTAADVDAACSSLKDPARQLLWICASPQSAAPPAEPAPPPPSVTPEPLTSPTPLEKLAEFVGKL